jgi:transcriptional regulator with XRE-family HTH domain
MIVDQHVGARLATKRRELGLEPSALAESLGVSPARLSGWERGSERIPAEVIVKLASELACKVSYFFEGPDEAERQEAVRRFKIVGGTDEG